METKLNPEVEQEKKFCYTRLNRLGSFSTTMTNTDRTKWFQMLKPNSNIRLKVPLPELYYISHIISLLMINDILYSHSHTCLRVVCSAVSIL